MGGLCIEKLAMCKGTQYPIFRIERMNAVLLLDSIEDVFHAVFPATSVENVWKYVEHSLLPRQIGNVKKPMVTEMYFFSSIGGASVVVEKFLWALGIETLQGLIVKVSYLILSPQPKERRHL